MIINLITIVSHFLSYTYSGSFLIKKESVQARPAVKINMIIGMGGFTSAIKGDRIVVNLAPILQIPKAVPAKMAGKI